MSKVNKNNIYLNKIKEILPKNMKKEKIDKIENIINEILFSNKNIEEEYDYEIEIQKVKDENRKYSNENTQLRLDNLKLHSENKKIHKLILKLNKENEELNDINKDLAEIAKQFEKIDLKTTVGVYTEE